jgi:hypothetical protein
MWFDAGEAKNLAPLSRSFERIPKASQRGQGVDAVLKKWWCRSSNSKHNMLNTYKSFQLGTFLKWALLDAGVAADYADEMTSRQCRKLGESG